MAPAQPASTVQPTPVEPAAPAATQPPASVPTPETPPLDPTLAKNWRIDAKNQKEQLVLQLLRRGAPLQEAYAEVYGTTPTTPASAAPAPAAQPDAAPPAPTKEVDSHLTQLNSERAKFQTDMDKAIEDGDTKTALALNTKLVRHELAIEKATTQRETILRQHEDRVVNQEVDRYQQAQQSSADKAIALYPQLGTKASEQRAQFNLWVAETRKDPANAGFFDSPNWPLAAARIVAEEQGWSRTAAAPAPTAQPAPSAPPAIMHPAHNPPPAHLPSAHVRATSAELVTSAAPVPGTTFAPSLEQFRQDAHRFTPEALNAILAAPPAKPIRGRL